MSRIVDAPRVEDFDERQISRTACKVRKHIIEMLAAAKSGHPGGSLSATDILSTLYFGGALEYDPKDPKNPARDRFILSKGHAAPVLYSVLMEVGYVPEEWLTTLRKLGSKLQGHPDMKKCPGVEASTGSLGQGLSIATGMALGLQLDDKAAGLALKDARHVFVLTGDGELQEGQNWEALMFAAHRKVNNLVAMVDWNNLQIDGHVDDILSLGDLKAKFEAFGWKVYTCDGHNIPAIQAALLEAKAYDKGPAVIIFKTIKGKGVSFMEDVCGWHGKAPSLEQRDEALGELDRLMDALGKEA